MKILHWIKNFGRVLVLLPVCLFLGVSVNAADLSFEVIADVKGAKVTVSENLTAIFSKGKTGDQKPNAPLGADL